MARDVNGVHCCRDFASSS